MNARATSFAGLHDLRQYIICRDNGGSPSHCLNLGDNGEGAWGDTTCRLDVSMVALPTSEMVRKWGSSRRARGKLVRFKLFGMGHGEWVTAQVRDKGPAGVIDLNPGALIAAGLPQETQLSCPAIWEWL